MLMCGEKKGLFYAGKCRVSSSDSEPAAPSIALVLKIGTFFFPSF